MDEIELVLKPDFTWAELSGKPAVIAAGATAAYARAAIGAADAAAILELQGTGFPGSSTETNNAPVGTYYTDVLGTAGAWRWLKTTAGSGSNKWTVVHGDTG